MSLILRNRWEYKGDNWWEWAAFLDDSGTGELGQVAYVEYILHPTFSSPIRKIDNPQNGFEMKTAGWGVFKLEAFVYLKNGKKIKLEHMIELNQQPSSGVSG